MVNMHSSEYLELLSHKNPKSRLNGIKLLKECNREVFGNSDLLNFFGNSTQDSDYRVRIAAIKALFFLHSECVPLWHEPFYQYAVVLLSDVFVEVQVEALMLFWLLSNLFSSKLVSINNSPPVNLIDYAFKKLCSCVTDVSPAACRLLGSLRNVNHDLIIQTMSKAVLNDDVERNEGDLDKQTSMTEFFGKPEIEARDATAMTCNDEVVQIVDRHLISSASAGAFIHGLEDEFMEVRSATIDSICELSQYSVQLGAMCTGPLVDMFNDEIKSIRDNAIDSLRKMGKLVTFSEEELGIVLATSEDKQITTRNAIYKLLKCTLIPNSFALRRSIDMLLQNLKTFPTDTHSIFLCLRSLGEQYSNFCETIVYDLLQIDARFLPREPNINDLEYIGKLVVILNATLKNRKIITMLPSYTKLHYQYMRDQWPLYTPRLDHYVIKFQDFSVVFNSGNMDQASLGEMKLLGKIEAFLQSNRALDAQKIVAQCKECFLRIYMLDHSLSVRSEYYLQYLRCLKITMKTGNPFSISHSSFGRAASKLLQLTYQIEHSYLGLSIASTLQFHLLRVYGHAMLLAYLQRYYSLFGNMRNSQRAGNAVDNIDLQHVLENFRTRIEIVRQKYQLHMLPIPPALDYWKNLVDPNEFVHESIFSSFSKDLLEYKLPALDGGVEERGLKKILAEITSPKCNIDSPLAFLTFFPIQISIEVFGSPMLTNKLMLRVQLPNNSAQFFPIPTSHFKPSKSFNFLVSTSVVLRHYDWELEKSELLISFVLLIDSDIPWLDCYFAKYYSSNTKQELTANVEYIEVSSRLKYYISPKDEGST